jgi:hypothetical protein
MPVLRSADLTGVKRPMHSIRDVNPRLVLVVVERVKEICPPVGDKRDCGAEVVET